MSASILSPLASPFFPVEGKYDESAFRAIYINGVPELVAFGEHSDHELIHNIPDEAIDELFPPTATDAAELDAADEFLRIMVDLSYLEDREEKARNGFSHVKKRWESRRQQGLMGKPSRGHIGTSRVIHSTSMINPTERNIVSFGNHITKPSFSDQDRRLKEKSTTKHQHMHTPRRCKGLHGHSRPIQQPRKMN